MRFPSIRAPERIHPRRKGLQDVNEQRVRTNINEDEQERNVVDGTHKRCSGRSPSRVAYNMMSLFSLAITTIMPIIFYFVIPPIFINGAPETLLDNAAQTVSKLCARKMLVCTSSVLLSS